MTNDDLEADLRSDDEVEALLDAGGKVVDVEPDGDPDVEGPNPA